MKKVLLFSGGRTSGFMLRHMLDTVMDYREQFVTCFCNTGKERNETLDFVHAVETNWDIPVVWLEYSRTEAIALPVDIFPTKRRNDNLRKAVAANETVHWFRKVDYDTASRNGEPFDELLGWMKPLPNVVSRGCSMQLKIRTAMRYLFSLGEKEYSSHIGIRNDERHRAIQILANCDKFEHPVFPLVENKINEREVLSFWKKNDFDLQLESYEGNCDLCFLKAKWKRIKIARERPESIEWWKNWEERKRLVNAGDGCVFRKGEPYSEIEEASKIPLPIDLFSLDSEPDIPCSCAERGFAPDETT